MPKWHNTQDLYNHIIIIIIPRYHLGVHAQMAQHTVLYIYYSYTIVISGVSRQLFNWVQALSKVTAQVDAYKLKLTEECTTCTYSYVTASTIYYCVEKNYYM